MTTYLFISSKGLIIIGLLYLLPCLLTFLMLHRATRFLYKSKEPFDFSTLQYFICFIPFFNIIMLVWNTPGFIKIEIERANHIRHTKRKIKDLESKIKILGTENAARSLNSELQSLKNILKELKRL